MMICLKSSSKQAEPSRAQLTLSERLPFHIVSDCHVTCDYSVRRVSDYYLLTLDVTGILPIQCQRCLETFQHQYANLTELAICRDDMTAENLMDHYECIVHQHHEVDLTSIVTDELHLYVPEKHPELIECTVKMECQV